MKRFIISAIAYLCILSTSIGQFELGVKAGVSSFDLAKEGIVFKEGNSEYKLNFSNAEYGVHFGVYSQIRFLGLYLEPAVLLNSNTVNFNLEEISENGPLNTLKSETYRNVDIPLLIGAKLGFLKLQAGPVAHFYLNSTSDLFSFSGYKHNFKSATYGGQIGLGVDVWKFQLDILYETNLSKFGEHIEIDGEQFAFGDEAGRVILTIGAKF